jgi:hypothetical protein
MDYRAFLLKHNGGEPDPPAFPITGFRNNPLGAIQKLFGINATVDVYDLDFVLEDLEGLIPRGVLPIGCTEGDDYVCLDTRREGIPVMYWDRRPFWGNNMWREEYLYPVAANFEAFLKSLQDSPY